MPDVPVAVGEGVDRLELVVDQGRIHDIGDGPAVLALDEVRASRTLKRTNQQVGIGQRPADPVQFAEPLRGPRHRHGQDREIEVGREAVGHEGPLPPVGGDEATAGGCLEVGPFHEVQSVRSG
ncbi:MAG: hypothetical protein PGN25_03730 [Methylorubrum populi]